LRHPEAPDGTVLPVTPKFKANLTARYEFDLGGLRVLRPGRAVGQTGNWTDLRLAEREPSSARQAGYTLVDVSAASPAIGRCRLTSRTSPTSGPA
jgi:iron complex outermembrane receptor protein